MEHLLNTIHHADCFDLLAMIPDGAVDAVISDPPYCSGGFSETGKRQAKGQGLRSETIRDIGWFINDNMTTSGLAWLLRSYAIEAKRILKSGGSLLLFTDWRMISHLTPAIESAGLRLQNLIVWDKGNMGLGVGFRPRHEMIMHFVKDVGVYYAVNAGNVIRASRVSNNKKHHQTEKPIELMARLIRVVSPVGGVIVDGFAGSGSTLVAAQSEGRQFIGCDISAEYVEIARKRLAMPFTPNMFDRLAIGD